MTSTAIPISAGPDWGSASITQLLMALFLAFAGMLGVLQMGAPLVSAQDDSLGYAAEVAGFTPGTYYTEGNCVPPVAPSNQEGTASGALGAPDYGTGASWNTAASLGNNGVLTLRMSVPFSGSGDSEPDIYIWEIGGGEGYSVDVSADGNSWTYVGEVGPGLPGERGYDVDSAGLGSNDLLWYVRITDLAHLDLNCNPGQSYSVTGADIDAVGVLTAAPYADLAIEKTSNIEDGTELAVGDVVTYTFTAENTGNVDLTGVTITDELEGVSDTTPLSADILAGESATFTATYEVTQDDIDAGEIVNSATATGQPPEACEQCTPPTSPPGEDTITFPQDPALTVEKAANTEGPVALGEEITYSFAVENTGNVTLTDVTITDPLPGLTWVTGPEVGDLAPGDTATGTATYVTTQADIDAGQVVNSATVTGTPPESCVDCDPTSPPSEDIVTTEDPNPAMTVTKVASTEGPAELNEIIFYEFTATNTGNVTLTNVSISDPLPGLSPIEPPSVETLAPGESATFTASYQVTVTDMANGSIVNEATGTGEPPEACVDCETTITNPPPVTVITEEPIPAIEITKVATNTAPVNVGDTITYEFTATNTGNVPLDNVTITDELPGLTWVTGPELGALLPGDTTSGSATYVVTEADIANGGVVNSATGTGTPPDECVDCVPPSHTPPPVEVPSANPAIALSKVADTEGPVNIGDVITYTFLVENTGNVPLDGVVITDALEGLAWVTGPELGTIDVGGSATGEATYTVTEADVANGGVFNSATATCETCGDGTPPSEVTVPTVEPGLEFAKTAEPASGVGVGDTITYTFTATNTGNVALDNVFITDALPGLTWVTGPELGTIAAGETATGTATYVVTQADVNAGGVYNSATITGTPPGGDPLTPPPSEVEVPTEVGTMGLALDKTVSPNTTVEAGDTVTYTFVVTNVGTTTADNITISDILPGLSEIEGPHGTSLAPSESATFTATYVVTEADAVLGVLSNTATATGTGPGGEELSGIDTARVRACTVPQPEDEDAVDAAATPTVEPTAEPTEVPGTPEVVPTEVPTEEPVGTPPADEPPVDEPPVDEPPVDEPPVDEPPVDEPPVDEPPVDEPPVDEPPVDEPPVDEPPVDEPPVDEPPVDEPPVDEPPVDDPPVDEPPAEEPPAEDPPAEEPPVNEPEGDPVVNRSQPGTVTRILLQDVSDDDLADCVPLPEPVDPEPEPEPVNPAPQQPAPPSSGGSSSGGGSTSGGGPVVTNLPSTGHAAQPQDAVSGALLASALGVVALALGATVYQIRRSRQM